MPRKPAASQIGTPRLSKRRGSPDRETANLALRSFSMVSWMTLMIGFAGIGFVSHRRSRKKHSVQGHNARSVVIIDYRVIPLILSFGPC
jgi:hypothetical protein